MSVYNRTLSHLHVLYLNLSLDRAFVGRGIDVYSIHNGCIVYVHYIGALLPATALYSINYSARATTNR